MLLHNAHAYFLYAFYEKTEALLAYRVEDDASTRLQHLANLLQHFFQSTSMSTDEHGIGSWKSRNIHLLEIANASDNARCTEFLSIELHQFFAFFSPFESCDIQMRELQLGLDGNRTCTKSHIPQ